MKQLKTVLFVVCSIFLVLCFAVPAAAETNEDYISDPKEFMNALKKGRETIYVDDLTFENDTNIILNYDVHLIGKKEKSTIQNAHFIVTGSNVSGKLVTINLENLILDGMVNKDDYPFDEEGLTFDEMFGSEREDLRCITAVWGYYEIAMTGCEVTRYASYEGPALYSDNNMEFQDGQRIVNLTGCLFHDNISFEGTVKMYHDKGVYNIDKCEFTGNTAKSAAGMVLSNGQVTVTDTEVCDNDFYRFINPKFPEEIFVTKSKAEYPHYNCVGAIHIGTPNATLINCIIRGNRSVWGGGLGIVSPEAISHGEKVEIIDCVIADNTATHGGGAIYFCSYTGQTARLINCLIYGNTAPKGGIMYTTKLAPHFPDTVGGTIEFIFCTMAENRDLDGGSFAYYNLNNPDDAGNIDLYGCFVIDSATTQSGSDNYIATTQKALDDGTITEESLNQIEEKGLRPVSGSAADFSVQPEVYSLWSEHFADATDARAIGAIFEKSESGSATIWIIIIAVVVVIAAVLIIIFLGKRKKKAVSGEIVTEEAAPETIRDYSSLSQEELIALIEKVFEGKGLTKKELEVASLLLVCEKRRDVADRLFVAEDTVKTHISHIFKKTGASSRQEFRRMVDKY